MRISPIGYLNTLDEVTKKAIQSAECSHSHPTAIRAAINVATAIFYVRNGVNLKEKLYGLPPIPEHGYGFYSAQSTSEIAFSIIKEVNSYEEAIRIAVYLGGDTDTLAAVTGSIAEPLFGIPDKFKDRSFVYMDDFQKQITENWYKYIHNLK